MGRNLSTKEMSLFIYQAVRPFRLSIFIMCMVGIVWAIDCSLCPYLLKTITDRISTISEVSRSNIFSNIGPPVAIYFFMTLINPTVFRFYNYFVEVKMMPKGPTESKLFLLPKSFCWQLGTKYCYFYFMASKLCFCC